MKKMVDMKMPKRSGKGMDAPTIAGGKEEYPYGLRLTLSDEQLSKLEDEDIAGLKVGDAVHIMAEGAVVAKRENEMQGGKKDRSIEIQIKKFCADPQSMMNNMSTKELANMLNEK